MKHSLVKKSGILFVLAGAIAAIGNRGIAAYPPDNAAVLYYRAILVYEKPEGAILDNLSAMIKDGAPASEETKQFLAKQHHVIRSITTAAEIKACDWGHDYSEGFSMLLPGLADMRNITRIVLADGVKALQDGDCRTAAQRCITTCKMARHLKTEVLINNLVAIAMESMAQSVGRQILARPVEPALLDLLKKELAQIELDEVPLEHCLRMEMKWALDQPIDKLIADIRAATSPGETAPMVEFDRALAERNIAFYRKKMNEYIGLVRLPYSQGVPKIAELQEAIEKDTTQEAQLSKATIPALKKIYTLYTRAHTGRNALRAAIEVYRIRARTGRLPDRLPPNLPQDMFSGEQFVYEITETGFTLRCRTADAESGKIEEYVFAVPK